MVATEKLLPDFLNPRRQFHQPPLTTGFGWGTKPCGALYEAIMQSGRDAIEYPSKWRCFFLGAVLLTNAPSGTPLVTNNLVLKGNQRLIATMLFLKALSEAVRPSSPLGSLLLSFVINTHPTRKCTPKTIPRKSERDTFLRLIEGKATAVDYGSRMGKALKYFNSRVACLGKEDLDTLVIGIHKTSLIESPLVS